MSDVQLSFSYGELAPEVVTEVRAATERIKLRLRRSAEDIIAIGQDLIAVKDKVGHGQFGAWLAAEFEMSQDTAGRFMNVATRFGADEFRTVRNLSPKALYDLAAPSTPEPVRQEVLARAEAGESVSLKEIAELKRQAAEAKAQADAAKRQQEHYVRQIEDLRANSANADKRVRELIRDLELAKTQAPSESARPGPEVEALKKRLATAEIERDEAEKMLAELHVDYREVEAELAALEAKPYEAERQANEAGQAEFDAHRADLLRQTQERMHVDGLKLKSKFAMSAVAGLANDIKEGYAKYPGSIETTKMAVADLSRVIEVYFGILNPASSEGSNVLKFKGAS